MSDTIKAIEAVAAPAGSGRFGVSVAREQTSADAAGERAVDADELRQALGEVRDTLAGAGVDLTYRVDRELNRVIVEVVDRRDGTVLRQIPGEEVLRLARLMKDGNGGLLQVEA